jgi:hypothetical protein
MVVATEVRRLRKMDKNKPGEVVVFDFFANGCHLVVDAVVTSVYRNYALSRIAAIPGYAAKHAEDRKFHAESSSLQINGGPHGLVPFAIKDGGRLGAHAIPLLRELVVVAVEKGRVPPFDKRASIVSPPTRISLEVHVRL